MRKCGKIHRDWCKVRHMQRTGLEQRGLLDEERLEAMERAFLGNPYRPEVRRLRRDLEGQPWLPKELAGWLRWWEALPPHLREDEVLGLVLCIAGSASVPAESRLERIDELAQNLHPDLRIGLAELTIRSLKVTEALERIVGDTAIMRQVRQQAWSAAFGESLARVRGLASLIQTTPVLIRGETGTGKELVAQALCLSMPGKREEGTWQAAPHETVHLASLPDTLVEGELFGHVKGAYTGATQTRQGVLERCHLGVVFLDEVAELQLKTQVSLLRTLQEGKVRPLGGAKDVEAAPRLVSATHQALEALVAGKRFRQDLYYRLSSVVITLPPLRERREDIPLIAEAEIARALTSLRGELKDRFDRFLRENAQEYYWPGNVRELSKVVRVLALGLEPRLASLSHEEPRNEVPEEILQGAWNLEKVKRWYAHHVLGLSSNKTEAASRLDVDRGTLRGLLEP